MTDYPAQLAIILTASGLPEPAREYRFHPTRRWRFDLAHTLATKTGRDPLAVLRWGARHARSDEAERIAPHLQTVLTTWPDLPLPADFPPPIRLSTTPILLYNAVSEEENWL